MTTEMGVLTDETKLANEFNLQKLVTSLNFTVKLGDFIKIQNDKLETMYFNVFKSNDHRDEIIVDACQYLCQNYYQKNYFDLVNPVQQVEEEENPTIQ